MITEINFVVVLRFSDTNELYVTMATEQFQYVVHLVTFNRFNDDNEEDTNQTGWCLLRNNMCVCVCVCAKI